MAGGRGRTGKPLERLVAVEDSQIGASGAEVPPLICTTLCTHSLIPFLSLYFEIISIQLASQPHVCANHWWGWHEQCSTKRVTSSSPGGVKPLGRQALAN